MNRMYLNIVLAIMIMTGVYACNTNKSTQNEENIVDNKPVIADSTKIQIDVALIDSISVIFTDNDSMAIIDKDDQPKIAEYMATAQYDTAWNDKGIMVKMVAPDYTLIIRHKGEEADKNDWLMMWKENGRTKFKNKWFFIADDRKEQVYQLLENYRESKNKNQ